MAATFEFILPPEITRRSNLLDSFQTRISNWIEPWDGESGADAVLLMAPFTRASQRGDSGGAHAPNAIRQAFNAYSTYSPDFDVDLKNLRVRDVGEVRLHMTDLVACHANIEHAMVELLATCADALPIIVGGDHSITAPLVRGYSRARPGEQIGIVQFDAHFDVRNLEDNGPHDGTPFRAILEGPPRVEGRNLVQIGVHGFMSSHHYKRWCDEKGVTQVSAREIRRRGIEAVMAEALEIAAAGTDAIYVTLDIDCLGHAQAPGSGGTSPEGMDAWGLIEAMFILGQHDKVKAVDVVGIDPLLDVRDATAKMGASIIATLLGGYVIRRTGGRGY